MAQWYRTIVLVLIFLLPIIFEAASSKAQTEEALMPGIERESMTIDKLGEIVLRLDSEARGLYNSRNRSHVDLRQHCGSHASACSCSIDERPGSVQPHSPNAREF